MKAMRVAWAGLVLVTFGNGAFAQSGSIRYGDEVPPEVDQIYAKGLECLVRTQSAEGYWEGDRGAGVTGLCVMAMLASGEDPNFGRYATPIRRGLRHMIAEQNVETGYLGQSMYHHGFGMLSLAEAYGAVDDELLWAGTGGTGQDHRAGPPGGGRLGGSVATWQSLARMALQSGLQRCGYLRFRCDVDGPARGAQRRDGGFRRSDPRSSGLL